MQPRTSPTQSIRRRLHAGIGLLALGASSLFTAPNAWSANDAASPPTPEPQARTLQRADGATVRWHLDRRDRSGRQGVLLLAQGSGCASVTGNANIVLAAATLRPADAVLTIEKAGVAPGDAPADPMDDCSAEFRAEHTVSRRVADASAVLDALANEPWWNGRLTLFGGSEGGAVVAQLAAQRPEVDAVVVFSTGVGEPLSVSLPAVLPPAAQAGLKAQLDAMRSDPTADRIWGGNTWRWWADIMDRRLADDLAQASGRVLLVHGERDESAPVASARAAAATLAAALGERFRYIEQAGLDHQMFDAEGRSRMEVVLGEVERWLAEGR
jgi:pimeloyl-ACP methyl ester carboxylesterase